MELAFEHPDYDDYWRQPGRAKDEHLEAMPDIPILWVGGWLDFFPGPMIEGYRRMVAMGRQNQALLVGPWRHWSFDTSAGDVNYGALGGGLTSRQQFLEPARAAGKEVPARGPAAGARRVADCHLSRPVSARERVRARSRAIAAPASPISAGPW